MPTRPRRPCGRAMCSELVDRGYCARHQPAPAPRPYKGNPYATRAWRELRAAKLTAEPLCRVCGEPATVVDHVVPLRKGEPVTRGPFQSLCARHHNSKTAREDGGYGNPRRAVEHPARVAAEGPSQGPFLPAAARAG
jgi:5-methylcytosine-specific restriction enzyme A